MRYNEKIKRLVTASMLATICCVATLAVQIPSPTQGYLHLGDAAVLLSGWLLGPLWGAIAAGLGSALADIFSGYAVYAPATFLLKAAVAALGCLLFQAFSKITPKITMFFLALSATLAELVMIAGYFLFEALVIGYGWAAVAGIPLNAVQAIFGIAVGMVLMQLLKRIHVRVHWEYTSK